MRFVAGVGENVCIGFVMVEAASEERDMVVRDDGKLTAGSVRVEGIVTTHAEEAVERVAVGERLEQHFLMISQKRNKAALMGQVDQPFNDALAVWSSVDVIAQGDDQVVGAGTNHCEQGIKCCRAPVYVTDGDGARFHGGIGMLTSSRMPRRTCGSYCPTGRRAARTPDWQSPGLRRRRM